MKKETEEVRESDVNVVILGPHCTYFFESGV